MAKQRGFLMIVVAILLVIVVALSMSFVAMTISGTNSSLSSMSANNAFDLAQTGIEQGSYDLTQATAWCNGAWQAPVTVSGQGEYQYSCTRNIASTTLSSAITASSTTVPLTSVAGLAAFGAIFLESEIVYYEGISGTTLQNARRGQNGTTAVAHSNGSPANQTQYIISSQGSVPSAAAPTGQVTLSQAVLLTNPYYATGVDSGSRGVILQFNGTSWTTALTTPANFTFRGIYNTLTNGIAVGSNSSSSGSIYLFNGFSWSLALSGIGSSNFQDVSCDTSSNCWIVGVGVSPARGLMYRYTFPTTFSYLATSNFTLLGVSCISGNCISVGSNRVYNFPSNTSLPFSSLTTLGSTLNDVNCPQVNSCVAVRSNGRVYYYNGAWSAAYNVAGGTSLNAVHCPTTSMCLLVGNNGRNYTCTLPITSAASCVSHATPTGGNLLGVHCNATNDCIAVGNSTSNAYRFNGTSWTSSALGATYTLNAITGIPNGGVIEATPTVWRNH